MTMTKTKYKWEQEGLRCQKIKQTRAIRSRHEAHHAITYISSHRPPAEVVHHIIEQMRGQAPRTITNSGEQGPNASIRTSWVKRQGNHRQYCCGLGLLHTLVSRK